MADRTPNTRLEKWMAKIAGETVDITPKDRLETLLAKIAGESVSITPDDTLEYWLNQIAENSSGGGSSDFTTATVTVTVNAGTGGAGLDGDISGSSGGFGFLETTLEGTRQISSALGSAGGATKTGEAILIKQPNEGNANIAYYHVIGLNPVASGDCTLTQTDGDYWLTVHGDCSITVDPVE